MRPLVTVAWRAFSIVACTSLNVVQIANGRYALAFVTGGLLSWIWWGNTRRAAHSDLRGAQAAYALGAGLGTVAGMALGRLMG